MTRGDQGSRARGIQALTAIVQDQIGIPAYYRDKAAQEPPRPINRPAPMPQAERDKSRQEVMAQALQDHISSHVGTSDPGWIRIAGPGD